MKLLEGRKILVVDDESALREVLKDELEYLGAQVKEAENGRVALALSQKEIFDAIISDIRMPGGDGVELLTRLREIHPSLPIVMLITGFSDLSTDDAYAKGAAAVFAKPFDLDVMTEALARLIQKPEERWTRKHQRIEANLKVELRFKNMTESISARAFNIGNGGMFLKLDQTLPEVGERLDFRVIFDQPAPSGLEGMGVVRWRRPKSLENESHGIGIEFVEMSSETIALVAEILRQLKPTAYIPKT